MRYVKPDYWNLRCTACEFLFHGLGLLRCPSCGSDKTEQVTLDVLSDSDLATLENGLQSAAARFVEIAAMFRTQEPVNARLAEQFDRQATEAMALRTRLMDAVSITLAVAVAVPVYQVIVGNVGKVYDGTDKAEAEKVYGEYEKISMVGHGRAAGEPVTLTCDGEIVVELEV